jgi:hypothetical protein
MDIQKLLRFFQKLYAHALTLQDLAESTEELRYADVRRKYDQQAAEQFSLLFRGTEDPQAFAGAVKAFLEAHPEPDRLQ